MYLSLRELRNKHKHIEYTKVNIQKTQILQRVWATYLVTCKCSWSKGGEVTDRKKGSGRNNKTDGRVACVKGEEVDGQ